MAIQTLYPAINPSLLLDFANVKALDPRITFTRTTTATYYDGKTVAKAEENFFTHSQAFSASVWTVSGATKTSTTETDPAGGSTALLLTKVSNNSYSLRQYATAGSSANRTFTFSFYLKGVAGETITLYMDNGVNQSFSTTVTLTADWARYTLTNTFNSTSASVTGGVSFNAGVTATSVYVAFAQVEERSAVTAYTPTTTQPITNYIPVLLTAAAGQARFDHNPVTGESLGLLIEEQRTNSLTYSDDFSNAAWTKTNSSIVSNIVVAPDGANTADKLIANSSNNTHTVNSSFTSGGTSTFSVFAKSGEENYLQIVFDRSAGGFYRAWFDLNAGTVGTTENSPTARITSVGNGWYRCSISATGVAASGFAYIAPATGDNVNTFTGNGFSGIYIWGAQLEAGAFPTSYIPTVAATVTRNADAANMTGANFSSWYRADEGTLYAESNTFGNLNTASNYWAAKIDDGTNNNQISLFKGGGVSQRNQGWVVVNDTAQALLTSAQAFVSGRYDKQIVSYKVNDFAFSSNAETVLTDTSGTVPVVTNLKLGFYLNSFFLNGTIKKIAYYPARLTNAQLQALTT